MEGEVDISNMTVCEVAKRGIKKILMELTSVKFLLLVFVGYVTAKHLTGDAVRLSIGIASMLLLVGIKEGVEIIKGKSI